MERKGTKSNYFMPTERILLPAGKNEAKHGCLLFFSIFGEIFSSKQGTNCVNIIGGRIACCLLPFASMSTQFVDMETKKVDKANNSMQQKHTLMSMCKSTMAIASHI